MEENGLVKTYMNIENLSFYDKSSDKHIKRTIVYPNSIPQDNIHKYFLKSISQEINLEINNDIENCICYFDYRELKIHKETQKNKIDNYWIDGEIHLMIHENEDFDKYKLIVLSTNLDKQEVFNKLKEKKKLIYLNTLEDCWIKRKGNEYETIII
jgi:hypothetical protein